MRFSNSLALVLFLLSSQFASSAPIISEPQLVLVTSASSSINQLTTEDVRLLYLGATKTINGKPIHPLLNRSDGYLLELFMQKVLFMSASTYERRILSRAFRLGDNRPSSFSGVHQLISALKADPNAVTYMYSDEAGAHPDIKILAVLWKKNN